MKCPVMYHLFKHEVESLALFSTLAVCFFSIGTFLLSCVVAVLVGYGFATQPLSEFGTMMISKAVWFIGLLAFMCFGWGVWALRSRASVIAKAEKETVRVRPDSSVTETH